MPISVKQFASEDEYEEWLERSGHAIEVLDIRRADAANGPRKSLINGKVKGAVLIKYQTKDPTLQRQTSRAVMGLRLLFVAMIATVVCVYAMRNQAPTGGPVKLLKLDK